VYSATSKARSFKSKLLRSTEEQIAINEQLIKAQEELKIAESEMQHILDKNQSMTIKAFKSGSLYVPEADDLPGRFLKQGELLGYILDKQPSTVRMAVSQDNIGQLREHIKNITIRFASDNAVDYPASIIRQAPEATNQLPSAALSTQGGGKFVVKPDSQQQLLTLEKVFVVDLEFNPQEHNIPLGTRAYVRIDHGGEPAAIQLYRRLRQVFLRQFNV